ncbi:helix-turn-helix domain-containing protein [Vibrio sp. SS-MA-C1-2]|uniref:helix-turn-helix domain-containing protein n=1 Tax=Vibrio sp. SS-MA-C1-2 TaxID=2908646 RepID=UPI001F39AD7E|nr:helix-turn-helix domain-containing protein [Vibrio sp. SS-MA-C1-2]UJF17224.1 helix-turn-helix domain-containing protein [Vibrio sp. SS-MA-C1-2]
MSRVATDWVWKLDVKPASLKLLLLSMADRADEEHCCFPSITRLEKDTGLNRKTIISSLQSLVDMKLLRDTGRRKGITRKVKVYCLMNIEPEQHNSKIHRKIKALTSIPKIKRNSPNITPIKPAVEKEQSQNRNDSNNGTLNSPKIGTLNSPNFGTQNQSLEPPIEPKKNKQKENLVFPLKNQKQFIVSDEEISSWRSEFPDLDISKICQDILCWLLANPNKQRSQKQTQGLIIRWFSRLRPKPTGDIKQKLSSKAQKLREISLAINTELEYLTSAKRRGYAAHVIQISERKISQLEHEKLAFA